MISELSYPTDRGYERVIMRIVLSSPSKQHRSRRGASNSISLVLAMPFYLCISALAVEIVMLGINQNALMTAVDRAAAQAKQWVPHRDSLREHSSSWEQQIHREVCKSLLPYAVTRERPNDQSTDNDIRRQLQESQFHSRMTEHYAVRWNRIAAATKVWVEEEPSTGPYQKLTIHVSYESPFWTPEIGRIMGTESESGANYYVWKLHQTNQIAVLKNQWKRTNLGIEFNPFQATKL